MEFIRKNGRNTVPELIFRELFENMEQYFLLWEVIFDETNKPYDFRLIDVNQSTIKAAKKTKEELIGKTYLEISPEITSQLFDFCIQVVLKGKSDKIEIAGSTSESWFAVSAYSLRREILAIVAYDITESKKISQELKSSVEQARARSQELEKVLDSVPAAVWIAHDPLGLKITGNKYSYHWLDLPLGANISKSAPEGERPETFIIRKDGRELAPEEMPVQLSARGEELRDFEFTLVYRDGSERHVLGNAVPLLDEKGNPTGSVSSFMDITARKKAEEELLESEQKWATTLASIGDAVIATDPDGLIIFMNSEAEELTGWRAQEVLNTPIMGVFQIIYEHTRLPAENPLLKARKRKTSGLTEEMLLISKDGREIPIDHNEALIKTKDGGVVIVFRDISEQRRSEEFMKNYSLNLEETVRIRTAELQAAKEHAESADLLKSAFLATMSHELRTPLNSIIGFSGILLREIPGSLNEEQKKQLGMIQVSGRNLLSLINEILDLSKIEAGQLTIHNENLNLLEVLEEVLKTEIPHANSKGISLKLINPESIFFISDKQRLYQILLNLVNNAIKFTDKGSVSIRCFRENQVINIEITDTGIGIENENLNKLFSPFFQVENPLIRTNKGSGLGLSICKKLAELLHGDISIKSEYGIGSTFTVSLPLKNPAE